MLHPQQPWPSLIGRSPRIDEVRRVVPRIGRSRTPVLILGESGTGKEVVARMIHQVCPTGEFVPIDCALLGTLLESELFGHTRGAFTGAIASKLGLMALADGGTAFFDEVAESPIEVQVKLLRLLQEKEIRPLGAVERRKANFRVIAATNRDLGREVERGSFRHDLYYRLNVVSLRLPPLRERREDVPELVAHFLERCGHGHQVSADLMKVMTEHDWPGNVRELENCIQRMVTMNSGPLLTTADLPSALSSRASAAAFDFGDPHPLPSEPERKSPAVVPLEDLERTAIFDALRYTTGDRSRAAELLGIGRTTLYRKLKQYGIA